MLYTHNDPFPWKLFNPPISIQGSRNPLHTLIDPLLFLGMPSGKERLPSLIFQPPFHPTIRKRKRIEKGSGMDFPGKKRRKGCCGSELRGGTNDLSRKNSPILKLNFPLPGTKFPIPPVDLTKGRTCKRKRIKTIGKQKERKIPKERGPIKTFSSFPDTILWTVRKGKSNPIAPFISFPEKGALKIANKGLGGRVESR
jgi:hypothetical protein